MSDETPLTLAQVKTLTPAQLQGRWAEVQNLLRGDPPKPEPADLSDPHLDLRTLTPEETNSNWDKVKAIIKQRADDRAEEDRIYRAESAERLRQREERKRARSGPTVVS